jgi:acetoin:2,6-dichlorophenolindophenol oxidoreductase subunit alpha
MNRDQAPEKRDEQRQGLIATRRGFLQGMAGAATAVTFLTTAARIARAGDIGYRAKDLSDPQLIQMYTTMLRIRWHERMMVDKMLTVQGYRGYNHFYAGQEAVAVGVMSTLRNTGTPDEVDYVFSTHRATGHALAKGMDMKKMAAEIDMRATGVNRGYGGSMHLSDPSIGFMGADGIVGPGAVIGAGAAFGIRAKGTKQVAVTFGGDGHFATPHFHSALNNAALLGLPFIYVIENNLYHQYAHYSYSAPLKDIATAAATYRIPGVVVDGQDVLAVFNVASVAVERARAGGGPTLIEAKTYRYYGHSGPAGAKPGQLGALGYDPLAITSFRSEREVKNWMARDPIEICRRTLVTWGVLDEARAAAIEAEARQEVVDAFKFADASPMCDPKAGLAHVFSKGEVPARQLG